MALYNTLFISWPQLGVQACEQSAALLGSPLGSNQPKQLHKQASVAPSCARRVDVPDFFPSFKPRVKKKPFCRLAPL